MPRRDWVQDDRTKPSNVYILGLEMGNEEKDIPEAKEVYVLMKSDYRISRNIRAQWFLKHLNQVIKIRPIINEKDCTDEIEIISAIPKIIQENVEPEDYIKYSTFRIVSDTKVSFLAARYRLAFCIDLGPSVASVDIQHGSVLFDEIFSVLRQSLESVSKPFFIPYSQFLFCPQVHITVIAHNPNCPSGIPQVLKQGWILTSQNVDSLLVQLQQSLHEIRECVAKATIKFNEENNRLRTCLDRKLSSMSSGKSNGTKNSTHILTADITTVNLLRYGYLALQLLPEDSTAGIVMITDGVLSFPSSQMLDSLLIQLKNSTVACSFLKIGSPYHPFSCFGLVPYKELMQFIAAATCGVFFSSAKDIQPSSRHLEMNSCHQAFLIWNFQITATPHFMEANDFPSISKDYWSIKNQYFYCVVKQSRVRKTHAEGNIKASVKNLLSCRLREGYTVRSVKFDKANKHIEIRLLLPWKLSINIEYIIVGSLDIDNQRKSSSTETQQSNSRFEVIIDSCYEFRHDVTCSAKKPIKSPYREAVIRHFWSYMKNLSHTDQMLVQLHSFAHNPVYYTIPESIKNGVPLFYWPLNSNNPELSSKNVAPVQFTSFWKPLCMLDINVWQKWMHTHRIGIILQHDIPLPKNLHLPNSSGRYVHIQCRQASAALNSLLTEYSSFVLVENHSYIKLLFSEVDKPPTSFCVIRVSSKAPCMVIRLAFLGGLPGFDRNEIVRELRDKILNLNLPKRATTKDVSLKGDQWRAQLPIITDAQCCFLLKKPVEKILIRYDRLPNSYMCLIDDNQINSGESHVIQQFTEHLAANMLLTLSQYLHHQRWIWTMQCGPNSSLELPAVSKILSTLTKIRLQEGFHFAHSSYGIIHMILEMPMKVPTTCFESEGSDGVSKEHYPCVIQYLLFPPHTNTTFRDSMSEEEDTEMAEADGELQLITECWVEPQYGFTASCSSSRLRNLSGLSYKQISQAIYYEDLECVSVMTTFEHLSMMCNIKGPSSFPLQKNSSDVSTAHEFCHPVICSTNSLADAAATAEISPTASLNVNSSILLIPYSFSLMRLLPLCHQTEIMFSSFYQVLQDVATDEADSPSRSNDLLFESFSNFVKQNHERELVLSLQDCMTFLLQVHHRERDPNQAPQVPFIHPEFHATDDSTTDKPAAASECKSPCCVRTKKVILREDSRASNSLLECMNIVERNVPRWRCFLKGMSSSRFIVTVIPASFIDLEKLVSDRMKLNTSNSHEKMQSPSSIHSTSHLNLVDDSPNASQDQKDCVGMPSTSVHDIRCYNELCFDPVTFPVYIYDCILSSVTNLLIQKEEKSFSSDSYEDHTFKCGEGSSHSAEGSSVKPNFNLEEPEKEVKAHSDISLKKQVLLVHNSFSKAFVYAVYRSLLLDLKVHKMDVEAAIDGICEESLLEIDITDFVFMICGHVKDFSTKINIKQKHLEGDMVNKKNSSNDSSDLISDAFNMQHKRRHHNCAFPLSLLQKHQPCKQLQQKHLDIKSRFSEILQGFFKIVPSYQDYYYFCPCKDDTASEGSICSNEHLSEIPDEEQDTKSLNNAAGEDVYETESHKGSFVCLPEDDTSICSHINTQSSLSSLENDADSSYSHLSKAHSPPLFIHLLCSVHIKNNLKSCSLSSLPTCLGDVLECIDADGEVDLDDLRITLDVTCLTLPSDIESPVVSQHRQYSTSFSSSSPVPETNRWKQGGKNVGNDIESLSSDCPSDTVQGGTLLHLPLHQYQAVHSCVEKVKWLLQDEMASASLDSYPIDSSVLKMVTNHVSNSKDNSCCITKEIPLQFVFGPDTSLDKFVEAFRRMSPPGYHLNEEDGNYYLVLDPDSAKKLHRPFSSLNPPLGIAGKYVIVQQNPHCDDSTELKNIGYENEMSLVFSRKEFSLHSQDNVIINHQYDDDSKSFETPFSNCRPFVTVHHGSKRTHCKKQEEDTETEDGNDCLRHKSRLNKRVIQKSAKVREQCMARAHSLPSTFYATDFLCTRHKRSLSANHNLPYNVTPIDAKLTTAHDFTRHNEFSANYETIDVCIDLDEFGIPCHRRAYPSSEPSLESGSEVSTFPPVSESSPVLESSTSREAHSIPMGSITSKFRPPDSTGSPVVCSETDFGSIAGSGNFSNTEDGYEGDSSDNDSEWDWLSTLDTRRPILPTFWLIMRICQSKVILHFHIRHRKLEDEELTESKAVLTNIVNIITNICKEVNQTLLLQVLHENRMCNQLLVPEDCDDIWKKNDPEPLSAFPRSFRKLSKEDMNSLSEVQEKYLEANLKFMPGAFDCDVVWTTHFTLHPRLTTAPSGSRKSRGLHALRSVLNKFSVNNRENMYVYKERSGSVFYLRLQEITCEDNHNLGKLKVEDSISLSGSCCSSVQSSSLKKVYAENDGEGFRSRVNSGHSDGDHQDASSVSGSILKKPQVCVAMFIHGIGDVGTEIKVDLVQVLQNRLNENLLDVITLMLSRNPLCKLTPEDVQFIQNPTQAPTSQLHFTIPVKLLGQAHPIHMYLRQNMLHFLHNPKYADNKKENHFKAFVNDSNEWSHVDDNDTFLFNYQQASGYSGSKGIACIVLSFVTGQGHPFQHSSSTPPNPSEYHDCLSELDYDELTCTSLYTIKSDRSPGPMALVQFQVWSVNKVSFEQLQKYLFNAVRHSLWDLLMEYHVLTAPVTDALATSSDDFSCYSEPTTPIRMRKTGRSAIDPNFQVKDLLTTSALLGSKEMSSSVPDIAAKPQSSPSVINDSTVFKFNSQEPPGKPESHSEVSVDVTPTVCEYSEGTDKQNLNYMFHSVIKSFLEFGNNLGCPTVSKHLFTLSSRHSVIIVLKEIQIIVKAINQDSYPDIFLRVTNVMNADTEFVPFTPAYGANLTQFSKDELEEARPGTTKSFIIVARNSKQWKAYMGMSDFLQFNENSVEALRSYQRFQTHLCNSSAVEKMQDSTPGSPTSVNKLSTPGLQGPHAKISGNSVTKSTINLSNSASPAFVPRQGLLLIFMEDKELTVFLYNWAQDVTNNLVKQFTKLIHWHHYRDALVSSIISQKLGLFHSQAFPCQVEKSEKHEVSRKLNEEKTFLTWSFVDQLVIQPFSARDTYSATPGIRTSAVSPKCSSILEALKNTRPPVPFHMSQYCSIKDPVMKYGLQLQETHKAQRRDMQDLRNLWQTRSTSYSNLIIDKILKHLKRVGRHSHYCLTPILFSPSWRWKVAPIRDHTLEPLEQLPTVNNRSSLDTNTTSRSRHSSGNSTKNADASGGNNNLPRSRRVSGASGPSSSQSSPKPRRNLSEEAWHSTVCSHYLQEYIQYLHTLGFLTIMPRNNPRTYNRKSIGSEEDSRNSKSCNTTGSILHFRSSVGGPHVSYLIKSLLGGMLVFEVGLCDPYSYGHLYSIERSRLLIRGSSTCNSQFTAAFLDELDKIKLMMHLHSFTYDYHLRTIHSYISGRQLIFRQGYHLTSFLDDFIKYYQKSPNCALNLLYAGSLTITDIHMHGHQLYNYMISHNQLYGMTVLRMVPIIQDSSAMMDTEFVLVELSAQKASYKDINDVCQFDSFDVGLLINHNTAEIPQDRKTLVLNYYIILTSQRELYPKLSNFGAAIGSFQTVRFGSSQSSNSSCYSSRKTSTVSLVNEKFGLDSSEEELLAQSHDSKQKLSTVRSMCDEDVTYLGYFSSQETMMQQVLKSQAEAAQTHLRGVVHRAAIHCRRDFLWKSLLPQSLKDKSSNKDMHDSILSYTEFSELLNLVTLIPLDDLDANLMAFLNMHISWYQSFSSVLKLKYADSYREFLAPDGTSQSIVLTHVRCPDSFMLLSIDLHMKRAELGLVFREPSRDMEHTAEKPNQKVLALHSLVEEFVNTCCFHLWSGLLC